MAKSVNDKDEAAVKDKIEQRVSRLEALTRIIEKVLEQHTGVNIGKDGKAHIGLIVFLMIVSLAFAASTTVWDIGTGVGETIGTCKVTTDGTNATLTIDKVTMGTQTVSSVSVTGNTYIEGTLNVKGNVTLTNSLTMGNATGVLTVSGTNNVNKLNATGAVQLDGGVTFDTNKFTIADATANTYIDGTLNVKGNVAFSNNLTSSATSVYTLAGTNNVTGVLKVNNVAGWSGVVTNLYGAGTNLYYWYNNGIVTNVSYSP